MSRAARAPVAVATLAVATLAACRSVDSGGASAGSAPVAPPPAPAAPRPEIFAPRVLARHPHDPSAFTEGLVFSGGALLESTGMYGTSSLRRADAASGRVAQRVDLAPDVFGEGLARLRDELYQLTWREHRCFVYDATTFARLREMPYPWEGWGLTTDGAQLVASDGSAVLRFLDPATLREVRAVTVRYRGAPVARLNELEWVRGEILANVWETSRIVRVDPETGDVRGTLDLSGLPEPHHDDPDAVLNGIAYDPASDRLFVTGKRWSSVFEIEH